MNPNEMQNLWNSPRNNLPTEAQQRLADQFARQMIRRRRFQSIWLINTFAWLTIITVLAIWTAAVGQTTPAQEWGLFPLLLVPWGFAVHFLRRYLKPVAPMTRGEITIVDSVRGALASNRETRSHLKLVGILYVIMIPLLALALRQLHLVGKVSERELTSMGLFFGAALLLGGFGIAVRYFARLLPQQKRLDALLAELAGEAR
jgi:hypothetical protein